MHAAPGMRATYSRATPLTTMSNARGHAIEPGANTVCARELVDGLRAMVTLLDLIERVHEHLEQHGPLAPLQPLNFLAAHLKFCTHVSGGVKKNCRTT
jgi:hypothetical protein